MCPFLLSSTSYENKNVKPFFSDPMYGIFLFALCLPSFHSYYFLFSIFHFQNVNHTVWNYIFSTTYDPNRFKVNCKLIQSKFVERIRFFLRSKNDTFDVKPDTKKKKNKTTTQQHRNPVQRWKENSAALVFNELMEI